MTKPANEAFISGGHRSTQTELERQYERRFDAQYAYRNGVWRVLTADFFQQFISPSSVVMDLGCGYGQFINNIRARSKYALDLNPRSRACVDSEVSLFEQDCAKRWPLEDKSLDVVFTSNFLEHLANKDLVRQTLQEARRCTKDDGQIICLGPNIRYVPGAYWDFWDHHVALSDRTVSEALELSGYKVRMRVPRFVPYTMAEGPQIPLLLVKLYVHLPFLWPIVGRQFLIIARAV